MNAKTLKALKESIAHWRGLKKDPLGIEGIYSEDCPLCALYVCAEGSCVGCPVFEKTGLPFCEGSPWMDVEDAYCSFNDTNPSSVAHKHWLGEFRKRAQLEIDFLKSLLPKQPARKK